MLELIIIRYLLKLDNYNKFRYYIKLKDSDKELKQLYSILDKLIVSYDRDITFDEFKLSVLSEYEELSYLLIQLEDADISNEVLSDLVKQVSNRSLAHDLALLSIDVSEGRKEVSELLDYYTKFEKQETIEDVTFVTDDLEELYEQTVHIPGLRWRLS